ncbi:efflux RND transporter permease subunit [Abyssibacter sp.]|uniref:efflux RND transporter permease subunit n=1 Tax=Abyssibacter sp. TaxID=2320200 RepID=UPI0025B7E461|nr:efflux RND transporter permease subunit [Abyssibacter sp.]MCK5859476.1 MMPL family transporter [Abyssibacter sp.]
MRMITTDDILRVVEPLVYARRGVGMLLLVLLTAFFGYQASQIKPDAGFEKSIPLQHPYMKVLKQYQSAFGGGNLIKVALIQEDGELYNEEFLSTLRKVTDDVFFIPGIDRSRVSSLFTPDVRYTEVVEGGFAGGNVIPAEYQPTQEMFDLIKTNVGKAGIIGRLVTQDQTGAMVNAELLEFDPVTGEKLDYRKVSHQLEEIRKTYETENIKIHVIGFAKVVGDVTDATLEVVGFFLLTLLMTMVLLWLYTGSFKLAVLPLVCSVVAVIWEFGLLRLFGYGLDPFAILVPFLVLSVSVSHGVQYANAWVGEVAHNGRNSFDASLETFRRLAIPGTTALITDVAGFATIYLIPIDIIREMSLNAAFGVAAIIVTNKVMMPIWLTWIKIGDIDSFKRKQAVRDRFGDGLWRLMAKNTRRTPAIVTLLICSILLGWSLWKYEDLQVGDSQSGVPELRPDSRYNQDSRAIVDNFSIGVDILKVIAETAPEACIRYEQMETIDRFAWEMSNLTDEVQSVISLPQVAKIINAGWNEGSLAWRVLPRNRYVIVQAITPVDTSSGLLNPDCSAMPVLIFTKDHKATTIHTITDAVKAFNVSNRAAFYEEHPDVSEDYCAEKSAKRDELGRLRLERDNLAALQTAEPDATRAEELEQINRRYSEVEDEFGALEEFCPVNFALASGNVGVMAATNEVVEAQEIQVVFWVYVVVVVFLWLSFRSFSGVLCVVLPLSLVSVMAYAVMASLGIGLKVATLPVVALAVGIGVDYGIYVYSQLADGVNRGHSLEEAFYRTLRQTGKAVVFTGVALGLGVGTWLFSALQFQADMGILLVFMFTANMFGAILVMPALAHFLVTKESAAKTGLSGH